MIRKLLDTQQKLLDTATEQHRHLHQMLLEQQGAPHNRLVAATPASEQEEKEVVARRASEKSEKDDVLMLESIPTYLSTASNNADNIYVEKFKQKYTNDSFSKFQSSHRLPSLKVRKGHGTLSGLGAHEYFDRLAGVLILLNACFVYGQADWVAKNPGKDQPAYLKVLESSFFVLFSIELILRVIAYRGEFFWGSEWRWNLFDVAVVATSCVEEILKLMSSNNWGAKVPSMRIVKITRVIRIVRVIRAFRELRIMFTSIVCTLRTVFWSLVCVLLLMSSVAAYIAIAASDHIAEVGEDPEVTEYFGSMALVMESLFQATSNGLDWRTLSAILSRVSVVAQFMLYGFISLMMYAVLNILTGLCLATATKAADDDLEYIIHEELQQENSVVVKLRRILHGDDSCRTDYIEWEQLQEYITDPGVRGYFKKLDLEPWHLHALFELLKVDEDDHRVNIDQYIRGCVRLRCRVKNIDMMMAAKDLQRHSECGFQGIHQVLEKRKSNCATELQLAHGRVKPDGPSRSGEDHRCKITL